jgi:hypothetical protein
MSRRDQPLGDPLEKEAAVQREHRCGNKGDNCRGTESAAGNRQNHRLEAAFQQLGREAGGAYDVGILRVGPSLQLLMKQWAFDVVKQMAQGGPSALCLACDTEFPPEHPDAFLTICAHRADPSIAILSPICTRCVSVVRVFGTTG